MEKSQDFSRRALDLSLAIYRVTQRLPEQEPLAGQLRQAGNEVAGEIAAGKFREAQNEIEKVLIYIKIARFQNWLRPANWSILDFEYYKLKQEVIFWLESEKLEKREEVKEEKPKDTSHNIKRPEKRVEISEPADSRRQAFINSRQQQIFEEIKKRKSSKLSDLIPLFKNVSERTLRNDLRMLKDSGKVGKRGFNRNSVYFIR